MDGITQSMVSVSLSIQSRLKHPPDPVEPNRPTRATYKSAEIQPNILQKELTGHEYISYT
jgi:hypothetical protein